MARQRRFRWFRTSIGIKLGAGFFAVILMLVASSWWSYQQMQSVQQSYRQLVQETYPLALRAERINTELQAQARMLMHYAATQDPEPIKGISASRERVNQHFEHLLRAAEYDPELAEITAALEEQRQKFDKTTSDVFLEGETMTPQQLLVYADDARAIGAMAQQEVARLIALMEQRVADAEAYAVAVADRSINTLLVLAGLSLAAGLFITIATFRSVAMPLRNLALQMADIAKGTGDLTVRVRAHGQDEIGLLATSFNELVSGLGKMVKQVIDASREIYAQSTMAQQTSASVAAAANQMNETVARVAEDTQRQAEGAAAANRTMHELTQAVNDIATGAQHQAVQVQSVTTTVSRMVRLMEEMAEQARQMVSASKGAAATAGKGARTVDETLAGMDRIRTRVLTAAERVRELDEYCGKIGDITRVISEIAEQTNLLALNAAIEAARAGEQGRGFAVVAEEVRRLATRANDSVDEIRTLLRNIEVGAAASMAAIDEGAQDVQEGAALASEAGQALHDILGVLNESIEAMGQVAASVDEVLASAQQVASSVEQVSAVTQESSAATEEMAAGATEVSDSITRVHQISQATSAAMEQAAATVSEVSDAIARIAEATQELVIIGEKLSRLVGQFNV